ncbi:Rad52/Rad22 family DNA repair protein [Pontibacillus halophilus]|uniref:Rad52/Rad22 family DNA repair protein n=1 Tax=Pontibacillus halophilus TaxID=516704 RepID=UPI0004012AE0|nr:Rad52/Rad22 family DNA repair protein [Pontibacillus halophilus]
MSDLRWDEIMRKLQEPFEQKVVKWRLNRAVKTNKGYKVILVPYLDKSSIQARLDQVVGPANWKNEYQEWRQNAVLCGISIRDPFTNEWITKYDGSDETEYQSTKGGFTGALKRAANVWGIGRYLNDIGEVWMDVNENGKNYFSTTVKEGDKKVPIKGKYDTPTLHERFMPKKGNQHPDSQSKEESQREEITRAQILKGVKSKLGIIGITTQPICLQVFKQANPDTEIETLKEIGESATWNELKNFYEALKPVAGIIFSAKKHKVNFKEVVDFVQLIKPIDTIDSMNALFFKLSNDDVVRVSDYIKDCWRAKRDNGEFENHAS